MSGIDSPIRIRKSLMAIADTDERKSYFYCLKLLGVLPPPPNSGFDKWLFTTVPSFNGYIPKCLHDVLIGSHATSCQHSSNFFSFYHRHLTVLCEVFLNFAHQILKGQFQRLGQAYPPSQQNFKNVQPFRSIKDFKFSQTTQFDFLYIEDNISKWGNIFEVYKKLVGVPQQIANHYWAPTNYLQNPDLTIPVELAAKQTSNDVVDILFLSINKSYPWDINTQRRWFNTKDQYSEDNFPFNSSKLPKTYQKQEQKFLQGQLDPRTNPDTYKPQITPPQDVIQPQFLYNIGAKNDYMVLNRTYNLYDKDKKNFRTNAIEQRQSLANYGAKSKGLQYITEQQQKQLIKQGNGGEWILNYNMALPHYQYGVALFGDIEQFIEGKGYKGVQRSHNYMHNNFKYIMSDSDYSLTSFVFYPYHSWIDAMIQFKLRSGNKPNQKTIYDYFYTMLNAKTYKVPSLLRSRFWSQFDRLATKTTDMSKWHLSGDDDIPKDVGGRYPIIQWYSKSNISFAFCSRDYILTKTNIRDSLHFNQIYQSPEYVKLYKERYSFFKDLDKFNYNYNYQIGSSPADKDNLLDQFASNIPQYITDMKKDIIAQNLAKNSSFQAALETKRIDRKAVQKQQVILQPASLQSFHGLNNTEFQESIHLSMRKIFKGSVKLFASYPSDIKNGSNPVYLKLKNLYKYLHKDERLNKAQLKDIERYISQGLKVSDIFIFGKQKKAKDCPKCQANKQVFLNLDDDIRLRIPHLWKYIQLQSLNQIYYDSNHPQSTLNCIYNKLQLVPNKKFLDYRLVSGAEEILIDVQTNIQTKEAKFLRIDAEVYSIRTNTIKTVVSKKHSTFYASFDFYKIFDLDSENERVDFDQYIYKKLKGWVSIGNQRIKFNFGIPCFQRLLRLTLVIRRDNGKLHIQLVDSDYKAKQTYYSSYKV